MAEVVSEGKDLEDCRRSSATPSQEMILAYQQQGKEIPLGNALIEQVRGSGRCPSTGVISSVIWQKTAFICCEKAAIIKSTPTISRPSR